MAKVILCVGEPLIRWTAIENQASLTKNDFRMYVGGDTLNVAIAAANLGSKTRFLSQIPDPKTNFLSQKILTHAHTFQVDTKRVKFGSGRVGTYFYEPKNQMFNAEVLYDRTNSAYCSFELSEAEIVEALDNVGLVHLSGISLYPNEKVRASLLKLVEAAAKLEIPVCLDLNFRKKLWPDYQSFLTAVEPFLKFVNFTIGWLELSGNFKPLNKNVEGYIEGNFRDSILQNLVKYDLDFVVFPNRVHYNGPIVGYHGHDIIHNHILSNPKKHKDFHFKIDKNYLKLVSDFNLSPPRIIPKYPVGAGDAFTGTFLHFLLKLLEIHKVKTLNELLSYELIEKKFEEALVFSQWAYALKHIYSGDETLANYEEIKKAKDNWVTKGNKINR